MRTWWTPCLLGSSVTVGKSLHHQPGVVKQRPCRRGICRLHVCKQSSIWEAQVTAHSNIMRFGQFGHEQFFQMTKARTFSDARLLLRPARCAVDKVGPTWANSAVANPTPRVLYPPSINVQKISQRPGPLLPAFWVVTVCVRVGGARENRQ